MTSGLLNKLVGETHRSTTGVAAPRNVGGGLTLFGSMSDEPLGIGAAKLAFNIC